MRAFYEADGARLSFTDSGAGLPIVFLHPTPLDGDYWRPLIENLPGIRAIVPDLRGHGASELGSNLPLGGFAPVSDAPVLTMAQLGSDILALLDHLRVEQAVFAGCSIGGNVLLELWRRAPQRMKGLVFICAKPQPDAETNKARRVTTITRARDGETAAIFDGMAETLVGAATRQRNPGIVAELRARMTLTAEALVAVQAGLASRPDSVPTAATITAPVLAIAGAEDSSVTAEEMAVLQTAPGGCSFHLVTDAGHLAAYERPKAVANRMNVWLNQFVPVV